MISILGGLVIIRRIEEMTSGFRMVNVDRFVRWANHETQHECRRTIAHEKGSVSIPHQYRRCRVERLGSLHRDANLVEELGCLPHLCFFELVLIAVNPLM